MRFKLIASDLDDTLLDENSRITPRSREVIGRAVSTGVKFVIATGRMFRTSVHYLQDLALDGDRPLINYHGALIKTSARQSIIMHHPLSNEYAIAIAEEAALRNCHVSVFIDDDLFIGEENEFSSFYKSFTAINPIPVGNLVGFLRGNGACPSKMSIIRWDGELDNVEASFKKRFGEELSILQSRPNFLEITAREATKGQALRRLAEMEGIRPEEVIAFGDGHNDLDMLRFAGLGVAVANARPEVREAANVVTVSNREDGVARAIEEYVLGEGT